MTNTELTFSQVIDAPPMDVYYAFSTAQGWRDWLCDSARFESRPGGSYQLAWSNGWYTAGTVRELAKPEKVSLTWFGKDDPGPTEVMVEFKAEGEETRVELRHLGFGQGKDWGKTLEDARKGWQMGLENLQSIFSTGKDLRTVRRPMLGIFLSDFNAEIAKQLNIPVEKGVRIDRPVEGMGAERAGLQPSDVIVEFDGHAIRGFADLTSAFQAKQAGDVVTVTVYRGPEKITADMELSSRPLADFPLDPVAIADQLRSANVKVMEDLRTLFEGVSEKEADFKPSEEEWSAKECLAHLITSEIFFTQNLIVELMGDGEREFSGDGGNEIAQLRALVEVTPTVPELLDRLDRSKKETVTLLGLAHKLKRRKGVLWRFGQTFLQYPEFHERTHMEQIQAMIEAARKERRK